MDIQLVMERRNRMKQCRQILPWALINVSLAVLTILDLRWSFIRSGPDSLTWIIQLVEWFLLVLFSTNAVYDLYLYSWPYFYMKPIQVTQAQKKLLGIKDDEIGFSLCSSQVNKSPSKEDSSRKQKLPPTPPFEMSSPSNNSFNSSLLSQHPTHSSFNSSLMTNRSLNNISNMSSSSPLNSTSSSWVYHQGNSPVSTSNTMRSPELSPSSPDENANAKNLLRSRNISKNNMNKSITDESSMWKYLKDYEEKEEQIEESKQMEKLNEQSNGLQLMAGIDESTPYQHYRTSMSVIGEDIDHLINIPASSRASEATLMKLKINEIQMNQWIENIRKWLSQTILKRLVVEIDKINDCLIKIGSIDSLIGEASLTDVKQAAILKKQIPSFDYVIPYLDLTSNQQYLVKRLKDLAKGGCITEFNWNGGASYNGKAWKEDLPTDSAIIMHALCTYMDSRLPYNPVCPEGKAFTKQHYKSMSDDKPKGSFYVEQVKVNPPHYKVIEDEIWELPIGRNNLFHALIVFLHCVKVKQYGLLGRINLGQSGLNILWVIDK